MMKYFILTSILFVSAQVQAYKYSETNKAVSPGQLLQEARRIGLATPSQERQQKNAMRAWKAETVKKHLDTAAPDTLLLELESGDQVEQAKTLAKVEFFKGVQKNWPALKNTVFNDIGAESWMEFEYKLRRDLERLEFSKSPDTKNFLFIAPWGYARVSKDLKRVSWAIEVSRNLDGNKLEDGAEDIVIPEQPRNRPAAELPPQ